MLNRNEISYLYSHLMRQWTKDITDPSNYITQEIITSIIVTFLSCKCCALPLEYTQGENGHHNLISFLHFLCHHCCQFNSTLLRRTQFPQRWWDLNLNIVSFSCILMALLLSACPCATLKACLASVDTEGQAEYCCSVIQIKLRHRRGLL